MLFWVKRVVVWHQLDQAMKHFLCSVRQRSSQPVPCIDTESRHFQCSGAHYCVHHFAWLIRTDTHAHTTIARQRSMRVCGDITNIARTTLHESPSLTSYIHKGWPAIVEHQPWNQLPRQISFSPKPQWKGWAPTDATVYRLKVGRFVKIEETRVQSYCNIPQM